MCPNPTRKLDPWIQLIQAHALGARQGTLDRWGTNKEFKVSKVVDRLASERSRVPFMADPKKA